MIKARVEILKQYPVFTRLFVLLLCSVPFIGGCDSLSAREGCSWTISKRSNHFPRVVEMALDDPPQYFNLRDPQIFTHSEGLALPIDAQSNDLDIARAEVNGPMDTLAVYPVGVGGTTIGIGTSFGAGDCQKLSTFHFEVSVVE